VVDVQNDGDDSHNGRPNEAALAQFLAGAAQKSRARFLVASGHVHNYERFYQDGIGYLVSGGGGARPRPVVREPKDLYQDPGFPNYHYVKLIIDGDHLRGSMIRLELPDAPMPTWQERDHFEITRQ
jgi:acid phosphatase type 7